MRVTNVSDELLPRRAPDGFDDEFFSWLDEMSDALMVVFAVPGGVSDQEVAEFEATLVRELPDDLRRFYARYNPWTPLRNWVWWERTSETIRRGLGSDAPLAPVHCASVSSTGTETVAVLDDAGGYEIVRRKKDTGQIERYPDLRTYFIEAVKFEGGNP
jgi:hypothetical protein